MHTMDNGVRCAKHGLTADKLQPDISLSLSSLQCEQPSRKNQ
jgi:hypothetical protein